LFQSLSVTHPLPRGECVIIRQLKLTHLPLNRTPDLLKYAEYEKANGRTDETIIDNIDRFYQVSKHCQDINDPEQFKLALANMKWANSTKFTTASSYTVYLKTIGKTWIMPKYVIQEKIYFIPTEAELDQLIASANDSLSAFLQLLKETGMRRGEAYQLEWKDIDQEHRTVAVNHPEKGSLPRILPITHKCLGMINHIPKDTNAPFSRTSSKKGLTTTFIELRNRVAKRTNNPRLKQISLHTFRHWKATTEYYKGRDGVHVRHLLGHRSAVMTDRYIHLVETLYHDDSGEWTCKVAHNEKEAADLIESGFTYVNNMGDTTALYRKRK
jgi:integrase